MMYKTIISSILPLYAQCNQYLLAADDSQTLVNAKYGNFEFHSWQNIGKNRLAVGGRNELLIYEPNADNVLEEKETIQLKPDNMTITNCQRSGNTINECDNILLAIGSNEADNIWVCGTHAARPILFKFDVNLSKAYERRSGQTCPSNSRSTTFIISDGETDLKKWNHSLFTITDDDHQPHIIKSNSETMEIELQTPEDELSRVWLNNPKFIATIDRGDRLFVFFREEIPSQNAELDSEWLNRVASICKNDAGGSNQSVFERVFMSFVKIQINCSQSKDTKFVFDKLISVIESGNSFYGIFTGSNSEGKFETGICEFTYSKIDEAFTNNKFLVESKLQDWNDFKNEKDEPYKHPYNCHAPCEYPLWLQLWRARNPLLSGKIESSPFLVFKGQSTSGIANEGNDKSERALFIGFSSGKVMKFNIVKNHILTGVSTKPAPTDYDCGQVKSLKMHQDHLLIAWEKCLLEEVGWNYESEPLSQEERDSMKSFQNKLNQMTELMSGTTAKLMKQMEDKYRIKMAEMELKVKDLQSVVNMLASKVEVKGDPRTMANILQDFDSLREKYEYSEGQLVSDSNEKYETLEKDIRNNKYRYDLQEKRVASNEQSIKQLRNQVRVSSSYYTTTPTRSKGVYHADNSADSMEDERSSSKSKRAYTNADIPITNRVGKIENTLRSLDQKVRQKDDAQRKQFAEHQVFVNATYQRVIHKAVELAKAKQESCHNWIQHIQEKVDSLEQDVTQIQHKKRRKRKTRSEKRKKTTEIKGQLLRGRGAEIVIPQVKSQHN